MTATRIEGESEKAPAPKWESLPREVFLPVQISPELCMECGNCTRACKQDAITFEGHRRVVDYSRCTGCLTCQKVCPRNAISVTSVTRQGPFHISVQADLCQAGCTTCVDSCPVHLYSRPPGGGPAVPDLGRLDQCRACHVCEESCPTGAIVVSTR